MKAITPNSETRGFGVLAIAMMALALVSYNGFKGLPLWPLPSLAIFAIGLSLAWWGGVRPLRYAVSVMGVLLMGYFAAVIFTALFG